MLSLKRSRHSPSLGTKMRLSLSSVPDPDRNSISWKSVGSVAPNDSVAPNSMKKKVCPLLSSLMTPPRRKRKSTSRNAELLYGCKVCEKMCAAVDNDAVVKICYAERDLAQEEMIWTRKTGISRLSFRGRRIWQRGWKGKCKVVWYQYTGSAV